MKKILIFAGTTEGRELSELLSEYRIYHYVCVATEYASFLMKENEYAKVHCERMDSDEMSKMIKEEGISLVVDATHPYAYEVSENIRSAASNTGITYLRLKRDLGDTVQNSLIRYFDSNEECAEALTKTEGNILLTTGSKELSVYASRESLKDRLFVRIIPNEESFNICRENGINAKHIIAMQGPFTLGMNEAISDMLDISFMVTKQSGANGGFENKVECALKKNIDLFVIGCDEKESGKNLKETVEEINRICGTDISTDTFFDISLIGIGMGDDASLSVGAKKAIDEADVIMGAKRLIENISHGKTLSFSVYKAEDIIHTLKEIEKNASEKCVKAAVLFSGDSSFFSGASSVYEALYKEIKEGSVKGRVEIIPGISSVSYFASKLGVSYSNAGILSIHGREVTNMVRKIQSEEKTFVLVSGKADVKEIGRKLVKAGLEDVKISLGINLSYEDEKVITLSPKECEAFDEDGLIICYIENSNAQKRRVAPGLTDDSFIRNTTPMTKEEIREVSLCKLHLKSDSVFWDIGSGTGSIAVEAALLSDEMSVYAIERKEEALKVLKENKEKYMLENIEIIEGEAPDAFEGLKAATHAFIGGSGGKLKEILSKLQKIDPNMRVVMNAVTVETIAEINKIEKEFSVKDFETVMVQISHSSKAGDHNLMKADNPIWICSFEFC